MSGNGTTTERVLFTLAEARKAPITPGLRSAQLFGRGTMKLRYYAPRGRDDQTPHNQDELYVTVSGHGKFLVDGNETAFRSGDVLFAPANAEHRFVDFTDDFATWVIFYGLEGGETP